MSYQSAEWAEAELDVLEERCSDDEIFRRWLEEEDQDALFELVTHSVPNDRTVARIRADWELYRADFVCAVMEGRR